MLCVSCVSFIVYFGSIDSKYICKYYIFIVYYFSCFSTQFSHVRLVMHGNKPCILIDLGHVSIPRGSDKVITVIQMRTVRLCQATVKADH